MSGLDVTARWELLTPKDEPIPEPENEDPSLRPPTELDGSMNPKYAMKETFVRGSFMGTTEKMQYAFVKESPITPLKKKARKSRKRTPTRQQYVTEIKPRVLGGPNINFLQRYGLDETSHPMDWFTAFMFREAIPTGTRLLDMLIWTRSIGQDGRGLSARMMTPQAPRLSRPPRLTCQRKNPRDSTACCCL
jgi:hypothetical protein